LLCEETRFEAAVTATTPIIEANVARRELAEIIAERFTRDELILFLRQDVTTLELISVLPGPESPPANLGDAFVDSLERRGLLDTALFSRLAISRPRIKMRLLQIASAFGLEPLKICPASNSALQFNSTAFGHTILAAGTTVLLATLFAKPTLLLLPVMLAPLLLLRSEASTSTGARAYIAYRQWVIRKIGMPRAIMKYMHDPMFVHLAVQCTRSFLLLVSLLVGSLVIRIYATLRHPVAGLNAILQNWCHFTFAEKLAAEPELVPNTGPTQIGSVRSPQTTFLIFLVINSGTPGILGYAIFEEQEGIGIDGLLLSGLLLLLFWNRLVRLTALLYRWSLKASFALWFPVALAVHAGARPGLPPDVYLEFAKSSELHRIRRLFAMVIIVAFTARCFDISCSASISRLNLFDGLPGLLLCAAAVMTLGLHYGVVEPAKEHLRLGIRDWKTITTLIECARAAVTLLVVTAVAHWLITTCLSSYP